MKNSFTPTLPVARILQIDILRGFALLGILMVNVFGYHASFYNFGGFYSQLSDPAQKEVFRWVIGLGADKFIFLFSLLFGFGFYLLYSKPHESEAVFSAFYSRRMAALALIGILHIVFFWAGDILLMYALLGFVLLGIRKWPTTALVLLSLFLYYFIGIYLLIKNVVPALPDPLSSTSNLSLENIVDVYSHGNYQEIMKLRLNEFVTFRNINLFYYAPKVMALFIAGYLFGKKQVVQKVFDLQKIFWIVALLFLATGLLFFFYGETWTAATMNPESAAFMSFSMAVYETGNVFLGLSYFLLVLLISSTRFGLKILYPLGFAGKMSLTNYLLQSVVFTTLFYGYGFGFFGHTNPSDFVIWAVILFVIQVIASKIWLSYHRYGPVEWLWRKLSYRNFR